MDTLYRSIRILRFPLMCLVVFIHSDVLSVEMNGTQLLSDQSYRLYEYIYRVISLEIADIAVPTFFFISGFLYFVNIKPSGEGIFRDYKRKTKARFYSLFVPYLFWNSIVLLLYFAAQTIFPSMMSGKNENICDFTFKDYLLSYWDTSSLNTNNQAVPIAHQMWFVRDLIVICLLSPVVYYLIIILKRWTLLVITMAWFMGFNLHVVIPFSSFYFFMFGAFYGVYKKDFGLQFYKVLQFAPLLCIFLIIADIMWGYYLIHQMMILCGMISIIGVAYSFSLRNIIKMPNYLSSSSFFIYCYHMMPLVFLMKIIVSMVKPTNSLSCVFIYLLCPSIIIVIGVVLYRLIELYCPRLLFLVSGKR